MQRVGWILGGVGDTHGGEFSSCGVDDSGEGESLGNEIDDSGKRELVDGFNGGDEFKVDGGLDGGDSGHEVADGLNGSTENVSSWVDFLIGMRREKVKTMSLIWWKSCVVKIGLEFKR